MLTYLIWITAVAAYGLSRFAERRIHRQNYTQLLDAGAEELQPRFMQQYYRLSWLMLPTFILEQVLLQQPIFLEMLIGGAALLMLALLLRLWAISTLGNYWSMRCMSFVGFERVSVGPYRLIRHPEYLSRLLDVVGFGLLFGAKISFLIFFVLLVLMTGRIAAIEQRQLRELAS